MIERTLILLKTDAIKRSLTGEIISRLEKIGLKIIGLKMVLANENLAEKHYKLTEDWIKSVAKKTKERVKTKETDLEIAKRIQTWNKNYLKECPTIAICLEGPHAVETVRKIVGHTEPRQALPGTIRGDFALESFQLSDQQERAAKNLIHASDSKETAEYEINLWFKKEELHNYKILHDHL